MTRVELKIWCQQTAIELPESYISHESFSFTRIKLTILKPPQLQYLCYLLIKNIYTIF